MTRKELSPYVGRIVEIHLKDSSYHIGLLEYIPEKQLKWGMMPELYQIGQVSFKAKDVLYVCICIEK